MQRTQEFWFFLPSFSSLSLFYLTHPFLLSVSHNRCCCSLISRFLISTPTMKTSLALQSKYMENLLQRHCQAFLFICWGFFCYVQNTSPEVWQKIQAAESHTCRTMLFFNSHNVELCPSCRRVFTSSQAWFQRSWSLCLGLESHVFQDHRNGYWWSFHIVISAYFGSCDCVWNSFAQNNGCHWIVSVPAVWLQRIIVAECPAGPGLTFSSLNWKGCVNIFQNVLPQFPAICASGTSYQHFDTCKNTEDVFTLWRTNVPSDILMPCLP